MNWPTLPLLLSGSITLFSIAVGAAAYRVLEGEQHVRVISLGPASSKPTRYHIVESKEPNRCVGTFTVSIISGSGQTTINLDGWVLVAVANHVDALKVEATSLFNALGQLNASLARASYNNESLRFGTTGVNPMTVHLYRGNGSDAPLLRHSVPGPIELTLRGGEYELHAPPLSALNGIHATQSPLSMAGLSVIPSTTESSCNAETAGHIDLAPLIQSASSLSQTAKKIVPGL